MARSRQRPTRSFLNGCIVGCVATFMLYMVLSYTAEEGRTISTAACVQLLGESNDTQESSGTSETDSGEYSLSERVRGLLQLASSLLPLRDEQVTWTTLSHDYVVRKPVMVTVLASQRQLQTAAVLAATTLNHPLVEFKVLVGGRLKPSLQEYVDSTASMHHVHVLTECGDFSFPLSATQLACSLSSLYSAYVNDHKWFVLATEQTYVSVGDLQELLVQLDHTDIVYMGRPGNRGDLVAKAANGLLANEVYCEEGPGIVLSQAALRGVWPHLGGCVSGRSQGDVELGKCFSRQLGTQCSKSAEMLKLFVLDTEGISALPDRLWYAPVFEQFITLYPITSPSHYYSVDLFAKSREAKRMHKTARKLDKHANQVCGFLPSTLKPPLTELEARLCRLDGAALYNTSLRYNMSRLNVTSVDVPKRFIPHDKYEVSEWKAIDGWKVYSSGSEVPMYGIGGEFRQELNHVIKKAVEYVQSQGYEGWVLHSLKNGYVRYGGTQGQEFILDLRFHNERGMEFNRRVHLLRPHLPSVVAMATEGPRKLSERVNFVVPLSHVNDRFTQFMNMYEHLCLTASSQENCKLILGIYGDKEYKKVQTSLQRYSRKYPEFEYSILQGSGVFTRGRALDLGLSTLEDAELAFLCDIDMTIERGFLDRCRLNAMRGSRVYYPAFFKYYDMDYVYRFKRKPSTFPIHRKHGHWAHYSYGMLCIYKSDYDSVGGFDTEIEGWGEEDIDLFDKVLEKELDILKAPDHGLFHRYHDKVCSTKLTSTQFKNCISSREESLADRMQLSEYVFYLEDKYNVRKRRLWS